MSAELHEKCGVVGVAGVDFEAARIVHTALWALQHRGQAGSGIVSSDYADLFVHKAPGLVAAVYNEEDIVGLPGEIAIGHNRYATSHGDQKIPVDHSQPVVPPDMIVAAAHNGNLPSTRALEQFLNSHGMAVRGKNDSELMTEAVAYYRRKGASLQESIREAYSLFTGAFSLLAMDARTMIAVRDAAGIRPLSLGRLNGGHIVASETCALDTVGATYERDVAPGEMVVITPGGMSSEQIVPGRQNLDIFETIYFARPDSMLLGQRVYEMRRRMGEYLAEEAPVDADIVVPVPDSAIPAAEGYSQRSGIQLATQALIRNRYILRTFIEGEPHVRRKGAALKYIPIPEILVGKDVVLVDDSIVRSLTSVLLVHMLREAGARRVHVRITSPPYRYPDFYGIDTPWQKDLAAAHMTVEQIRQAIGADSLHYLSLEHTIAATGIPPENLCTAVFTGKYPIDIGERAQQIERVDWLEAEDRAAWA